MTDRHKAGQEAAKTAKERHGEESHAKFGKKGGEEHTPNIESSRKGGQHSHSGGRTKKDESER